MTNGERSEIYINGAWYSPAAERRIEVINPATEKTIGSVPDCSKDDVNAAAEAARQAFDRGDWSRSTLADRTAVLESALQALEPKLEDIAALVTTEMGLPSTIASQFIPSALATARFFLSAAAEVPTTEFREGRVTAAVLRQPVGVVASIAPWNAPFNTVIAKVIPALVSGCSIIYKPAPETPLDCYFLADALEQAGLPQGVFNLITGGRDVGRAMVAHPSVDKISFTGSTAAGRDIGAACGHHLKRCQLELGGKSAAIIADDAPLETVLPGLARGCFFNTGQVCASFSRVLAPIDRYDEIVEGLKTTAESFVVGDPTDPTTTMGPLVSAAQRDRVESYIEEGRKEGAKLVTGGKRPSGLTRGWYVEPTVFAEVDNNMRIAREEIFGPVAAIIPYEGIENAITIANDSDYGLHGGVFTQDYDLAAYVAKQVRTGTFSVNSFVYNVEAPFGGVKCSGLGRDTGREAIESMYELKTINIDPEMKAFFQ